MVFLCACLSCACLVVWREEREKRENARLTVFFSIVFVSSSTRRRSSFLAFYSFDLCLDQPTLKPPKKKR